MNVLEFEKRNLILRLLVEGCSLRSIERTIECSYNTIFKFFVDAGRMAQQYQKENLININCKSIQIDELWSFCYAKQKNVNKMDYPPANSGSIWTWVAICADSKLVMSWHIGQRTSINAHHFISDLKDRVNCDAHIISDGYKPYIEAIANIYGSDVNFAMLVKQYDKNNHYTGADKKVIQGKPDLEKISTSYVERQNLTMRMGIKRYSRKTNAFSKKFESHCLATSLHFLYYNFVRVHKSLGTTPAVASGLTNKEWQLQDITKMVKREAPKERGSYHKMTA